MIAGCKIKLWHHKNQWHHKKFDKRKKNFLWWGLFAPSFRAIAWAVQWKVNGFGGWGRGRGGRELNLHLRIGLRHCHSIFHFDWDGKECKVKYKMTWPGVEIYYMPLFGKLHKANNKDFIVDNVLIVRSSRQMCSVEKGLLETFCKFNRITPVSVSLFNKSMLKNFHERLHIL